MKSFNLDFKEVLVSSTRKGWINYWGEETENLENLKEFENAEEAWEYVNEKGLNNINSDYCKIGTLIKITLKIENKVIKEVYTCRGCFDDDLEEIFKSIKRTILVEF